MAQGYKQALDNCFEEVATGKADLYVYFFAKGLSLLRYGGYVAYITPNKFTNSLYGYNLRNMLKKNFSIETLINFGDIPVFYATTYPLISIIRKVKSLSNEIEFISEEALKRTIQFSDSSNEEIRQKLGDFHIFARYLFKIMNQDDLGDSEWVISNLNSVSLLEKMKSMGTILSKVVKYGITLGIKTGHNKSFIIDKNTKDRITNLSKEASDYIRPFIKGKDVRRWKCRFSDRFIILSNRGSGIMNIQSLNIHFEAHKEQLSSRATVGSHEWFELQQPQEKYQRLFILKKIVYPDISQYPRFFIDREGLYLDMTLFSIPIDDDQEYLCSLLNSKLLFFFMAMISPSVQGQSYRFKTSYMEQIPIVTPSPEVQRKLESFTDDSRLDELNQIVYELYGLTPEEIALVEELTAPAFAKIQAQANGDSDLLDAEEE